MIARRYLLSVLVLLLAPAALLAQTSSILEVQVYQHTWTGPDGTIVFPFSNYGVLKVTAIEPPTGQILWLNATINGQWAVQNEALIEIDGMGQLQDYSYDFPLPTPPGVPMTGVDVQIELTPLQLTAPPLGPPLLLPVQEQFYFPGSVVRAPDPTPLPVIPTPAILIPFPPDPITVIWKAARRRGVPGVDEAQNHCVPGAYARSFAWMNQMYCLGLPDSCDEAQELYDAFRTAMQTTEADGTSTIPDNDLTGLNQILADKNLTDCLSVEYRPDFGANPPNPCDLFNALERGCDVITYVGWLGAGGNRVNGHAVTVVGAVKCGERVRIFYKDDVHGDDEQGDGEADDGVKSATFEAGGPTGYRLRGMSSNQWEGFVAVCPSAFWVNFSILKRVLELYSLLPLIDPIFPDPILLEELVKIACDIEDNARRLYAILAANPTTPPDLLDTAACLLEFAFQLKGLSLAFWFDLDPLHYFDIQSLLPEIEAKAFLIEQLLSAEPEFVRGDCNGDGAINIADAITLLNQLFGGGGATSSCQDACDANDDGNVDIGDAIAILNVLFGGGGPLPAPSLCGPDPTPDGLGCDSYPCP
ncbi:MAG: dockerin type I repeat-containing protein [Planctomycetes bacterium]|nr:dockerin type I repeat-containing protein [Planctomycetota bacterium]